MKVLQICRNLAGSTVFPQLFETLQGQGLDQLVFVPEDGEQNRGKNVPRGVETHYAVTIRKTDTLLFWRKAQRTVPYMLRELPLSDIDMVHAHTLFTDGSIALELSHRQKLPYMLTLRYSDVATIWRYEPHLRPLARRILQGAERVVVLSPVVRDQVLCWVSGQERTDLERKISVIPNGIDPAWLDGSPKLLHAAPVRVGFAGVLSRRKRPMDALRAVHLADGGAGKFCLYACGRGPLEGRLRAGLKENDIYLGPVSGMEAMKAFYKECDLLLVPSVAETFGMVYLEAMSQGVPVLYTKGQGFDGQFPEGEVGFAVASDHPRDQAEKIQMILQNYEERSRRCVENARQFAWPQIAEKWMALYTGAAAGHGPVQER